ncbi:MAG: anthranilate synthase component I family protein [Bacteroidia bacterium]|nr:anthranilate synthase component I family protein [Bacteroidia bacterium]
MITDKTLNLQRLSQFRYAIFLCTAPETQDAYGEWDWLAAASTNEQAELVTISQVESAPKPILGGIQYDWKNEIEPELKEHHQTNPPFLKFFKPDWWIGKKTKFSELEWNGKVPFQELFSEEPISMHSSQPVHFQSNFTKEEYIATIHRIKDLILDGDFYELNFAQEWSAWVKDCEPASWFRKLLRQSPVPMAAYFKWKTEHYLCISPERFLKLNSLNQLISQPIKGTAKRPRDLVQEKIIIDKLANDEKIRAENVMIVDLVRNDLHRSCLKNSVYVPKLFEIQRYANLFHVVSTVVGQKRDNITALQAIQNTFPAGSMTGAPKFRVMERISELERTPRGMYAGSIGYIFEDTFDFNVVIRTLVWNEKTNRLSYHSGGAITFDSNPEQEYEETLLKAYFIEQTLKNV